MELRDELAYHGALVYLGEAGVHVEDLRAGATLFDGHVHHVVVVARAQRLLHQTLARGIDALTNDAHLTVVERADLLRARHGKAVAYMALCRHAPDEKLVLAGYVLGRRAAAAANHGDAGVEHAGHGLGVLLGPHVIGGYAIDHVRQAGVSLRHHGAGRPREHPLDQRCHCRGAKPAVNAHNVRAKRGERDCRGLWRGSQEGTAVLPKGHGHERRQVRVLAHGEQGRLRLGKVCHGLDHKEVCTGSVGGTHLLGKEVVCVVEGKRAHGREELTRGAKIRRHVACAGLARAGHRRREDLLNACRAAKLGRVGTKGVGGNDLGTGSNVGGMHLADLRGVGEAEQLRKFTGRKAARLQLRAHGTIKEQKLLAT